MYIILVSVTLFLLILSLMAVNRLNIGILLFLIISFKNIKSSPGPEGPRGLQGDKGKQGNKQDCPMCVKPLNTFGYQGIKHKEKELRMENMLEDIN